MITQENTNQPLVSVIVITYNSAKFVIETLNSAKTQTYPNVELVISDDHSTDESVDICKKWIDENKDSFVKTTLVTSDSNTGIPANLNRGVDKANGKWIKCIAGDDILADDCLTELINFIYSQKDDVRILSADIIIFSGKSVNNGQIKRNPYTRFCSMESSAKDQYEMLLRTNMVFAQAMIIRRDLLIALNGFDEKYRLLEDWPLWIKATSAGYKIYYLNKPLVFYRFHENNLSLTTNKNYLYHPINKLVLKFKENELLHRLPFIERWGLKHDILSIKTCFFLGNDKRNPFTKFVFFIFDISNPFYNYLRMRKMLGLKYHNYN